MLELGLYLVMIVPYILPVVCSTATAEKIIVI